MKCPYCGEELKEWDRRLYCENMACSANHEDLPQFIWQDLIDGKKAFLALESCNVLLDTLLKIYIKPNTQESRSIQSIIDVIQPFAKQNVENKDDLINDYQKAEIETLTKQLKQAREALELFSTIKIESQQRASLYDDILGHPIIVLARIRDIARGTIADITQQDTKEVAA